ncbi:MAG: hypothetical protein GX604_05965 [Actinobacteria bacterium]|nr:hypothetical protein [Actinomycetota bacterium]
MADGSHEPPPAPAGGSAAAGIRGPGGLILSFVALMLLFDWDWGLLWPVFLVLVGLGMLLGWRSH